MGCNSSKEGQPTGSSTAVKKNENEPSDAKADGTNGAGERFREPSVVVKDQKVDPMTKKMVQDVKSNIKNAAHHVKNIFAMPLNSLDWSTYVIPRNPKTKSDEELIQKALKNNFVFEHLSSKEIQPLILAFESHSVEKGEEIIEQGDKGEFFYIIQNGSVIFKVDNKQVGMAPAGASFGELALLCKLNETRLFVCRLCFNPGVEND
jgi:hypothetical protein